MVNGPIGTTGIYVVLLVAVEHSIDPELAPILLHSMEAKTAVEKTKKIALAIINHVQVNDFWLILA